MRIDYSKKKFCIIQNITYLNYLTFPLSLDTDTAQKMKFPIKDLFSKCDQIRRKLPVWSHLLNKSLMENFIFYVVRRVAQSG